MMLRLPVRSLVLVALLVLVVLTGALIPLMATSSPEGGSQVYADSDDDQEREDRDEDDEGDGGSKDDQKDTPAGRLLVADGETGLLQVLDLRKGKVIKKFRVAGPASVYTTESGRIGAAFQGAASQVNFVDSGLVFREKDGKLRKRDPRLLRFGLDGSSLGALRPVHFESHDGRVSAHFDGSAADGIDAHNFIIPDTRKDIDVLERSVATKHLEWSLPRPPDSSLRSEGVNHVVVQTSGAQPHLRRCPAIASLVPGLQTNVTSSKGAVAALDQTDLADTLSSCALHYP